MGTRPWDEIKANRNKREMAEILRWESIVNDESGQWFTELGLIESTMLGYEDHGILSSMITINFGGSIQGGGGYAFDRYVEDLDTRIPEGPYLGLWVQALLRVTNKDEWERLPRSTVYAIRKSNSLNAPIVGFASSYPHSGHMRVMLFEDIFKGQP